MTEIKIFCPNCGQHIQCDNSCRGAQINCPSCKQAFEIPAAQQVAASPPASPAHLRISKQDEPMFMVMKDGTQYGPYSSETLKGYLEAGQLSYEDLAWREGFRDWQPLREIIPPPGFHRPPPPIKSRHTPAPSLGEQNQETAFNAAVVKVTPVAYLTPTIFGLNIFIYLVMSIGGVGWFVREPTQMVQWGADFWPLTTGGEWWRLLTSTFLHFGLAHLAFNMVALLNAGILTERLFGNASFAFIYLFGMIASSIGSDWWYHSNAVVCAGASGAIFAVYGALLAYLAFQSDSFPKDVVKSLASSGLFFVGYNVFFGALHEGISNAAHLTGLAAGFVSGAAFCRPLQAAERSYQSISRFLMGSTVCMLAVSAGLFFIPKYTGLKTADLEAQVQDSIKQKFLESADTRSVKIIKFTLIHENGSKYRGLLEAEQDNRRETLNVDVTYDGRTFIWKILPDSVETASNRNNVSKNKGSDQHTAEQNRAIMQFKVGRVHLGNSFPTVREAFPDIALTEYDNSKVIVKYVTTSTPMGDVCEFTFRNGTLFDIVVFYTAASVARSGGYHQIYNNLVSKYGKADSDKTSEFDCLHASGWYFFSVDRLLSFVANTNGTVMINTHIISFETKVN